VTPRLLLSILLVWPAAALAEPDIAPDPEPAPVAVPEPEPEPTPPVAETVPETAVVETPAPAPARPETSSWELGIDGGVSLQTDQYVGGARLDFRAARVKFVSLQLALLAGLGPDYMTLRPSLRIRPRLQVRWFRGTLIVGASLYGYTPRGQFADFCDKADLACRGTALGLEVGLGLAAGPFGVDFVVGTGDLPLYTIVGGITFNL
jgi:hypothetical protein